MVIRSSLAIRSTSAVIETRTRRRSKAASAFRNSCVPVCHVGHQMRRRYRSSSFCVANRIGKAVGVFSCHGVRQPVLTLDVLLSLTAEAAEVGLHYQSAIGPLSPINRRQILAISLSGCRSDVGPVVNGIHCQSSGPGQPIAVHRRRKSAKSTPNI